MGNFYVQTAREKYDLPADWDWFRMEAIGPRTGHYDAVILTGAVAPLITRGKRKGSKNWRMRDKATEVRVVVTDADIDACKARYEASTGNCSTCEGSGQQWAGWSAKDGNRFIPCCRCGATGKVQAEAA